MKRDELVGEGTTTLDYLYVAHPWLKKLIQSKDRKIKRLESKLKTISNKKRKEI